MKVTLLISTLAAGGAERVAAVLANGWAKKYQVELITNTQDTPFYQLAPEVVKKTIPFKYGKQSGLGYLAETFRRLVALRDHLKTSDADYFISFKIETNIKVGIASLFLKQRPRIVFCEHNNYFARNSLLSRIVRLLVYRFTGDLITVLTEQDIQNYPGYLHQKIRVMPNPLGIEMDQQQEPESGDPSLIRLVAVGRLTRQKGFDRMIRICQQLEQQMPVAWRLDIYGDGPLKEQLKQQIQAAGLSDRVRINDPVSDIASVYRQSDVFLMTSRWEGLPMVLGEAMHLGLPVLSYDCQTGPREFIDDQVTGFLVREGDQDTFIQRLLQLAESPDLRRQFGQQGHLKSKSYSLNQVQSVWENQVFQSLDTDFASR